jgi:hypothetical protein
MEEEISSGAVGLGTVVQTGRSRLQFLPAALMALWSTQTLTNMSTRDMSQGKGVKAAGGYGWQSCHLHVPVI